MTALDAYIADHFWTCPRCNVRVAIPFGRCWLCGMRPDEEGPPSDRFIRALCDASPLGAVPEPPKD